MWAVALQRDFEQAMEDDVLPKVPSISLLEWHRSIAAFFAGYKLDGSGRDMYSQLLLGLRKKRLLGRVTLGSTNYDCLLEQAMLEHKICFDYMLEDPLPQESIPLLKIHGSCNFITHDLYSWRPYLTNSNASSIECAFTTVPVVNLENCLQEKFRTFQPAFYPVLGLYSKDKPSIVAPAKFQSLRNILAERIGLASAVILIGLRPNLRDPHLWDPIAQTHASAIMYVGSQSDYGTLKKLQSRSVHAAETFEVGMTTILGAL